jgi:hypothetical protein
VPVLTTMVRSQVARLSGVSKRHVIRLLQMKQTPSPELRGRLIQIAADHARAQIGRDAPTDDLQACALLLHNEERML